MYYKIRNEDGVNVAVTTDQPGAEATAQLLSASWALLRAAQIAHDTLKAFIGEDAFSVQELRSAIGAATLPAQKQMNEQLTSAKGK